MPSLAERLKVARAELRAQLMEHGGDGQLRDVQAFLCEDGRTVMVFAEWTSDEPACTSFKFYKRIAQSEFDRAIYLACDGV
jgi:hypothetical protein